MKKLIFTTLAVLMISFSSLAIDGSNKRDKCPQEEYITYFDNGQERMIANINCEGQLNGTFVEYFENGEIHGYGEFLDGKKHGTWVVFNLFDDTVWVSEFISGERISVKKLKEETNLVFTQ